MQIPYVETWHSIIIEIVIVFTFYEVIFGVAG